MDERKLLTEAFEQRRGHLRGVAYRMLGSLSEADDAVQEAWLRLNRADRSDVENLGAWLTTVVARVCLHMLQSRKSRGEEPLDVYVPDLLVSQADAPGPDSEALLADSVGLALLVVLETLAPAERLAFVLHDMFAVPFEEIASMVGKSPAAARQLASRARRRIQGTAPAPDTDLSAQREVVSAFLTAARGGDFDGLLAVLDPDVVLHADYGAVPTKAPRVVRGARAVAGGAVAYSRQGRITRPALVNGGAGLISYEEGRPVSVLGFTFARGKIVGMHILSDPARLARLNLPEFLD